MSSSVEFSSESVSEGHPHKVADRISDAILDACLAVDPRARVAAETLVTAGRCILEDLAAWMRERGRGEDHR